jgi:hypothetical protein
VYAGGRHLTLWIERRAVARLSDPRSSVAAFVERFDLCLPAKHLRMERVKELLKTEPPGASRRPALRGQVLIGVIDSGCPFAHERLRAVNNAGAITTRIAAIWDMRHGKGAPTSMGYGSQVLRDGAEGLDERIQGYRRQDGSVEELSLYQTVRHRALYARGTHGAHVLDLLAGPVTLGARLPRSEDEPPTWKEAGDPASSWNKSDIAFVQLPDGALQDSSGGWLGAHMLDGVSYLVDCADPPTTTDVVINISYGCTVGPHDGSSILERALDAIVDRIRIHGPSVHICVAAGNSFDQRGHAMLADHAFSQSGLSAPLAWRILPGAEAPSFLQLWLPHKSDAKLAVRIEPPGEAGVWLRVGEVKVWGSSDDPRATVVFLNRHSRGEDSPMLLVAVGPTEIVEGLNEVEGRRRAPAPHGDWIVRVQMDTHAPPPSGTEFHAYIARNDRDMGTLLRGRQSYFVDEADEPSKFLRGCADDPGMDPGDVDDAAARTGAVTGRRGTLNGIATAGRVRRLAGYELRRMQHAPYSSAGKSGSLRGRGPSAAMVTDESAGLRGVRAGGAMSGAVVRLVGTSAAAPQDARRIVNTRKHAAPPVPPVPDPNDPQDGADLWGDEGRLP